MDNEPLTVNAHIHTPHSFSAFDSIAHAVELAKNETIACLGINDFNTIAGFKEFGDACIGAGIYPLFNIEFITLLQADKLARLRWNDPKNPGIMYFCGKALDHPTAMSPAVSAALRELWQGTQDQACRVIERLNAYLEEKKMTPRFSYEGIRDEYAKATVRERHIAKAIYFAFEQQFQSTNARERAYQHLFGSQEFSLSGTPDALQDEIRSRLLKAGQPVFVDENPDAFLEPELVRGYILDAGGVPCYPVFADDSGSIPERERNVDVLADTLEKMGVYAVEFIPARNTSAHLKQYAVRFSERGFCVVFGTEHNTPTLTPMTPAARNGVSFDQELRQIAYRGACILAAHQELRRGRGEGFVRRDGCRAVDVAELDELARFGDAAIRRVAG